MKPKCKKGSEEQEEAQVQEEDQEAEKPKCKNKNPGRFDWGAHVSVKRFNS